MTVSAVPVVGLPATDMEGKQDGGFSLEVLAAPLDGLPTLSFFEPLIEFTVLPMLDVEEGVTMLLVLHAPIEILVGVTVLPLLYVLVGITLLTWLELVLGVTVVPILGELKLRAGDFWFSPQGRETGAANAGLCGVDLGWNGTPVWAGLHLDLGGVLHHTEDAQLRTSGVRP